MAIRDKHKRLRKLSMICRVHADHAQALSVQASRKEANQAHKLELAEQKLEDAVLYWQALTETTRLDPAFLHAAMTHIDISENATAQERENLSQERDRLKQALHGQAVAATRSETISLKRAQARRVLQRKQEEERLDTLLMMRPLQRAPS